MIRRDGAFDVIVVGGGINGIGVYPRTGVAGPARAAGRAQRLLLRLQRGALAHDPWRPALPGERRVRSGLGIAARARRAACSMRRTWCAPLPTTIPINSVFSGLLNGAAGFLGMTSRPASSGALPIKIGLMLYDWITRHRRLLPKHRFRGARATLRHWPALSPRLRFSATYHDAWISYPERLGVELILDTKRLAPRSVALNHAEITRAGAGFVVTDGPTGSRSARQDEGSRQRHRRLAGYGAGQPLRRRCERGALRLRHQGLAPDPRLSCAARRPATAT